MEDYSGAPDFGLIIEMQKLKNLQKEVDDLKKELKMTEQAKKVEITLAQQLLLLYYLGLLKAIDLNTKAKSILLSKILNRNCDNIRKNITYIDSSINSSKKSHSKIKNVENLEVILAIFESLSMSELVDKVKVDLNKIK